MARKKKVEKKKIEEKKIEPKVDPTPSPEKKEETPHWVGGHKA